MKRFLVFLLAATLTLGAASALAVDIAILVPNADHGWTGAVLTYSEEKAAEINAAGVYTAAVFPASDQANQIALLEDIIENRSARSVVILPYDNTLETTMRKLADSGIPFVMYDRVIDAVYEWCVSSVKGDNEGIGIATAERFIASGLQPGDPVLIIPGDNSSVPQMRNDGFFTTLLANGWTQEQVNAIHSTDYTGWSRAQGKQLFVEWLDASTVDEITATRFIFTHDDEIAMGMLEALKGSEIDPVKKEAFLSAGVHLGTSSGLNEIYSVLKGIHQKDYSEEVARLADLFSVTYDPGMVQIAIQDMVDFLDGKDVPKDHVVPVHVVDASNVSEFRGFGDPVSR